MVFSDTSNYDGIIQRCEDYTGMANGAISGDTTTLKKFTSHVNEAVYDLVTEIIQSQDAFDWDDPNNADYPIGTFALTTNRDYVFPTSLKFLKLKRVDITYDGSTWYRAAPIDSAELPALGNATTEDSNFNKTEPRYDPKSNGFWLYPRASAADVAAGASARIEFIREFDEFLYTDASQEPPIDRPFHDLVALGAALKWAVAKDADRATNLKGLYDEGVEKLREHYGKKNLDSQLLLNPSVASYS